MTTNRVQIVEHNLDAYLQEARPATRLLAPDDPIRPGSTLTARAALGLFEDQALSRALDVAARELKKTEPELLYDLQRRSRAERRAAALLLRSDDPCMLHYRSGALMMARARGSCRAATPLFDTLLSLCAPSVDDPDQRGPPQGLGQPQAVGSAADEHDRLAPAQGRRHGLRAHAGRGAWGLTCVRICGRTRSCVARSATRRCNHATALARPATPRAGRTGAATRCPVLFVCEDNGTRDFGRDAPRAGSRRASDGLSAPPLLRARAGRARRDLGGGAGRDRRTAAAPAAPVFLHLDTACASGGMRAADLETAYRSLDEIRADRGPAIRSCWPTRGASIETGAATPEPARSRCCRGPRARVAEECRGGLAEPRAAHDAASR